MAPSEPERPAGNQSAADRFEGVRFVGEDWYARELGATQFIECIFIDCDLTEVATEGAVFDRCQFRGVALNASVHDTTRFDNCVFTDGSLFGATLRHCKLTGSIFSNTALRPLTVDGGLLNWVNFFGADLRGVNFDGVNLEETDFGEARLEKASFRGADLTRATLRASVLDGADFRGAILDGVQLGGLSWRGVRIDQRLALQIAESLGAIVE
jgi:fluoroquinolone resistance protein